MSKPITREEQFLAAMAGEGTAPKPLTRKEQFMAKSAGQAETAPTPLTRKEGFMDDISIGGGGSSANVFAVEIYNEQVLSGKVYFPFEQGDTFIDVFQTKDVDRFLDSGYQFYAGTMYVDQQNASVFVGTPFDGTMLKGTDVIDATKTYYVNHTEGEDCLVAGSMITVPGKKGAVDVMDVKVGTAVTTLDPETLELKSTKVELLHRKAEGHEYSHVWYRFKFDDDSEIHLTGMHRFYNVETGKFEWLQDFKVGDRAYKIDGTMPRLVSVEKIREDVKWNSFWNENKDCYFVDGFLSGNKSSVVPNIKG